MARNYIQPGETLTVIAPRAVAAGSGVLAGAIFGIALRDAASGAQVEIRRVGVFDTVKTAGQAWTQGAKLYWDNTAFALTTTAASNTLVGAAAQAQAAASVVGRVVLTGQIAA